MTESALPVLLEVCVDSVESAVRYRIVSLSTADTESETDISAIRGGADRLELCANLGFGGGTTPSLGLLTTVLSMVGDASIMVSLFCFFFEGGGTIVDDFIKAMVRPRMGDFVYSEEEIGIMLEDIHVFKKCGVRGIVTGALTPDGRVDVECMKRFAIARVYEPPHV
jgi:copper homeostasis protein